jgi:outer membrane receptor protein involved in Fe transport
MSKAYSLFAIFLSIVFLNPFYLLASEPGQVKGVVVDTETAQPIPSASVELLRSTDSTLVKGVVTGKDGSYLLDNILNGTFLVRVSCLGYQKTILPKFEISEGNRLVNLGLTKLFPEIKSLNEVTVTAPKLSGVIKDDKTIYAVTAKAAEIAQSGLELLRQVPDVTVNYFSDEVKLAGSSKILFQVNGRKVDSNYLMQLNPGLVDKIEVIHHPGSHFESEVDAVVNIVLKRNLQYGMGGMLRLQVPTSNAVLSKNNASLDVFFKKVRLSVGAKNKFYNYAVENSNERNAYHTGSFLSQATQGKEKGNSVSTNYGIDWFINERNTLSAYGSVQPTMPSHVDLVTGNKYSGDQTTYTTGFTSKTDKDYISDYSIYFQHKFQKKSHQVSFEHYWSNKTNKDAGSYYELGDLTLPEKLNIQEQSTKSGNTYFYMKGDYSYPLMEKLILSTGYNWYHLNKDFIYDDLIAAYSDVTGYKENRQAAYISLSSNLGKLSVQAGLRYEYSKIHIRHVYDTIKTYNDILPSLNVSYKAGGKSIFRLNYRKSLGRPGIDQLSPANYKDDPYAQSAGNPALNPSASNRFELEHRLQFNKSIYVNYRPYISFLKDGIQQVNVLVSDSVLRKQYSNVNKEMEYGLIFSGNLSVKDIWTITPSVTYYRKKLDALPEYGINEALKDHSWRINVSSQYALPKEWLLFLEFNYEAPTITYQSEKHSYYDCMLGFNKTFNRKFTVSAFTLNPWSSKYVYDKRTYKAENVVQRTENSIKYDYLFIIRLGYKFSSGKSGKKNNWEIENEKEQAPTKGILN